MRLIVTSITLLFVAMTLGTGAVAHAAHTNTDISLSLIRAVRISTTSITLSFTTDETAAGKVRYTDITGAAITLTDSVGQTDHLFTIDELDPSHGYTFVLTAENAQHGSNQYSILLSPETVGDPGQSEVPPVDVLAVDGTRISSSLSTSTAAASPHAPSAWVFLITAIGVLGAWSVYRFLQKIRLEG